MSLLSWQFARAGMGRLFASAVFWGSFSIGVRCVAAAIILPLTLTRLPVETVGIWYLFLNVLSMTSLFDIGFGQIAGRALVQGGHIGVPGFFGHTPAQLIGTLRRAYQWMGIGAFVVLSVAGGAWIAWKSTPLADHASVLTAWALFCPVFALMMAGGFERSLLFGVNQAAAIHAALAVGQCSQLALTWYGLLHGWGLLVLAGGNTAMAAVGLVTLRLFSRREETLRRLREIPSSFDPKIFGNLWNASWKVSLNQIGIYLSVNAGLTVGAATLPLSQIASYGLSLQILFLVSQASALWIEVKQPLYARLYATSLPGLRRLFFSRIRLMIGTALLLSCAAAAVGNPVLHLIHARALLLPPLPFLVLALYLLLQLHHSHFESLGICLNRNPFPIPLVASGLLGCALAALLVPHLGLWGLLLGPLAVQAAFNNWWIVAQGMRLMELEPRSYFRCLLRGAPSSENRQV